MSDLTATAPNVGSSNMAQSRTLRLQTLIRLRWLAVSGQIVTILVVSQLMKYELPLWPCISLVALSVLLNSYLYARHPSTRRLSPRSAMFVLGFDILQLAGLLFLTGGLVNPFSVLICVPVIIASASLPISRTWMLGILTIACVALLWFYALPLPWGDSDRPSIPPTYLIGVGFAIMCMTVFAAFYAYRVSAEANQLAQALTATELALQREQHLSAIDGLAAAAAHELGTPLATISVVAKEMQRSLNPDNPLYEDTQLLTSQSQRCRDILQRLTTLSTDDEAHMRRLPFSSMIEEVIAPHREFGIDIESSIDANSEHEPVSRRNAGIIFGLGNIMENAVDYAEKHVKLIASYDTEKVLITIEDDGPGYSESVLQQIGEPYMKHRSDNQLERAGGLGLGVFIAKTLLERSGAQLIFDNKHYPDRGASVTIKWPRAALDTMSRNL